MRSFLGILLGFVAWTVLWLGGNFVLLKLFPGAFPEAGEFQVSERKALLSALGLSVVCSLVAGSVAARQAGRGAAAVGVLGGILLAVGAAVEIANWKVMPLWYHLVFLALLVPATLLGGIFAPRRA